MKIRNLLFIFAIFIAILTVPVSAATFSDVDEGDWYYDVVEAGVANGYIDGFEDGTFRPNNTVSNAEFYKMIATAFNIEIPEMEQTHWAAPYARALYRDGNRNIQTYPGYFDVGIKRKDAIRNLVFAAGDIRTVFSSKYFDIETFEDMPLPTIWHYDGYILIAQINGIVSGDENGLLNPENTLTRAEAVTLIERALAVEDWVVKEPDILNKLNIKYIGNYAETFKESLYVGLDKFSDEIIDKFIKDNGKIIITDENYEKYYGRKSKAEVSGLYQPDTNTIVLFTNGQSASLFFDITDTFIHEFGHYIYDEIVEVSDRKALQEIFKEGIEPKELSSVVYDNYGETNANEFWAELVCYQVSAKMGGRANILKSQAILDKYVEEYNYFQ